MRFAWLCALPLVACGLLTGSDEPPPPPAPNILMQQDCVAPTRPSIPDGNSADWEQIRATHRSVQSYVQQGHDFVACISYEEKSLGKDADLSQRVSFQRRAEKMQKDMETVAEHFNEQLRIIRARDGAESE